jgi:hypothetical protein
VSEIWYRPTFLILVQHAKHGGLLSAHARAEKGKKHTRMAKTSILFAQQMFSLQTGFWRKNGTGISLQEKGQKIKEWNGDSEPNVRNTIETTWWRSLLSLDGLSYLKVCSRLNTFFRLCNKSRIMTIFSLYSHNNNICKIIIIM